MHDIILGGNIAFYAKWIECGQRPLLLDHRLKSAFKYYTEAPLISLSRLTTGATYTCTPLEAEQAGYSADPNEYSFPRRDAQK